MNVFIQITYKALRQFQKETGNNTMPMQQLLIFLAVAERGVIPMSDLKEAAGVEQSSVSRNVSLLGLGIACEGKSGYGLIGAREQVFNRKAKEVFLTPHGAAVARSMGLAAVAIDQPFAHVV